LEFFETSAKDNINVKMVFERLVDIICNKMVESLDNDPAMFTANGNQPPKRLSDKPASSDADGSGCMC
jgi:Ras-related protein Rab-3C